MKSCGMISAISIKLKFGKSVENKKRNVNKFWLTSEKGRKNM
jgi:hypothetical protein